MHSGYIKLITAPHATYEAGDVLSVCNHNTVRKMAGWKVCGERLQNRRYAGLNRHGFVPHSHLLKDWCSSTCEAMCERLNRTQARFTRLRDAREIVVTTGEPYANFRGQDERYFDVEQFFALKIQTLQKENAQGVTLFSDDGDHNKVMMYYGRTNANSAAMDTIWTAIETKTGKLEATETSYENQPPFGSPDSRGRLIIRVDDFSDEETGILTSPLLDETDPDNPITIKKRSRYIDWRNDLGLSVGDVTDVENGTRREHRSVEQARDTVVRVKP